MSFNGSGVYSPPAASFPAVTGTVIDSAKYNAVINDISSALTGVITKDGQTTVTANLPMATYRHTGVSDGAALTEYATVNQVTDNALAYGGASAAGTDTYAVSLTISPESYAAGNRYQFIADVANTGECTINFNGLGDKDIKLVDGTDPHDAAIQTSMVDVEYDGTNFVLLNPHTVISSFGRTLIDDASEAAALTTLGAVGLTENNTISGDNSFTGTNTFTKTQKLAKGSDIASATNLTLGTDGNYFDVTGTTTINTIDTVGVGTVIKLRFDASLTLTHNATNLDLPGRRDLTTNIGDDIEFTEYATGNWRCTGFKAREGFLQSSFTSSEQTITSAGSLTVAHGLIVSPSLIQCKLICKTIDQSYAVNDEVMISSDIIGDTLSQGTSIVPDATNLNIRFGSSTAVYRAVNKSTGAGVALTNSSWRLIVRAWV